MSWRPDTGIIRKITSARIVSNHFHQPPCLFCAPKMCLFLGVFVDFHLFLRIFFSIYNPTILIKFLSWEAIFVFFTVVFFCKPLKTFESEKIHFKVMCPIFWVFFSNFWRSISLLLFNLKAFCKRCRMRSWLFYLNTRPNKPVGRGVADPPPPKSLKFENVPKK